jgi:hypothetical protein
MGDTEAEVLADLKTARKNISALIVQVTTNPKPSYREAGREFKWAEYLDVLRRQFEAIDGQVKAYEGVGEEDTFAII